ncbi:MAG: GNAT family N-acetyltransferase [Candidatus Limnocylindrales bacterium]
MLDRTFAVSAERPLTTARLILRPYTADDLPRLHDLFGREDVCRFLAWPLMDLEQARAKLEQRLLQTHIGPKQEAMVPAAVEVATGRVVGEFMLGARSLDSEWRASVA